MSVGRRRWEVTLLEMDVAGREEGEVVGGTHRTELQLMGREKS